MTAVRGEERYRRIVESIDRLPSLPAVAGRLIDVVNSPDSSADDAAELIEKDPALTSKLLRLANSAFYGMPRTISSVSSAVVILGFNTIRSVALSASIMKMFPGKGAGAAFDHARFWRHSIVSAMIARSIARRLFNFMMIDPESAFCAGILHDIGRLIFAQFAPEDCGSACEYAKANSVPLVDAESAVMGITHARIGSILADKWALPPDLESALVFHHDPGHAPSGKELVSVVHLADTVCHAASVDLWEGEAAPRPWDGVREYLRIGDDDYAALQEEAAKSIERSDEFFSIIG
ncbi:MAG: HDOD domain-containing protein [Chitinivibrionales bacterium]|nr:HDOD domain-containing protein [Chitinivibrionales bacterium]MBD3396976.1 HDOD domain-containing protein [Chitinivibrionales bacterium]